ncbi:SDR family oxidoreductase [Calothrix sp. 336/3]|uniref:SDR family oxidoreductase n=1 Tax=Calothrix sp. 336/3 TaxID=1337936 RepID=UPI0004E46CC5|nr:SDR family oxidoreductase [Calothrix sp. 336/3]AKG20013.1 short-chain dehydrogenase [Calothrix sp. 336/3]
MGKTVLITGASSGIGKVTAKLFLENGWNVVATARNPQNLRELPPGKQLLSVCLDVTDSATISQAINQAIAHFGKIDVLVNNAGYGLMGAFEAVDSEQVQRQFQTNVFGLFDVTRAVLPHFREQKAGVIINLSSMGGRLTFPFFSLYHGTKFAIEGFSESLQYELAPWNIRVKLIEPGQIRTDFGGRSLDVPPPTGISAYDTNFQKMIQLTESTYKLGATPDVVAKTIYRAATDNSKRLRYPVAAPILILRKILPDGLFFRFIKQFLR